MPNQLLRMCSLCRQNAERAVLDIVASRSWRWETSIIHAAEKKIKNLSWSNGEDLLFLLVQAKKLEWFGAEEGAKVRPDRRPSRFEGMLKYRVPSKK